MKSNFNKNKNKNKKNKFKGMQIDNSASISDNKDVGDGNQIISGYFLNEKSYKELAVQRVNNFLYGVLIFLIAFCLVCYYFVSCKEVQLNKISRDTLELNYENDELQNKVDSLQSYYNIDKAVSSTNMLERARHVVEVDAITLPELNLNKRQAKKSLVVSY